MPSGVEQISISKTWTRATRVNPTKMPSGVEQTKNKCRDQNVADVNPTKMPSGVEQVWENVPGVLSDK